METPWTLYIRVRSDHLLSNHDAAERRQQLAALAGVSAEQIRVEDILPASGGQAAGAAVYVVSVVRPINENETDGAAADASGMVYDAQAITRLLQVGQNEDFYVATDLAAAQGGQSSPSSTSLSTVAIIGIAVGAAVAGIALLTTIVFVTHRKHKNKIGAPTDELELRARGQ